MVRRTRTQEKIQGILGDVLKHVPSGDDLFANVGRGRDNLLKSASREITKLVARIDVQKVLEEILRSHRIRISAEIEFEPKSKARKGKRNG